MTLHTRRISKVALAFAGLLVVQLGCASNTGSKRFAFEASAAGVVLTEAGPFTFTNQTGWNITLTEADVTLGPVYLNVIPPLRGTARRTFDWFIPSANAQASEHLDTGRRVGEVLGQVTFSALSSELVPFPVQGTLTEEEVRTVEVWFYPAPGVSPDTTQIDTVALSVAGEAARAGLLVAFRGVLVLDETWLADQPTGTRGSQSIAEIRQVRGIETSFLPHEGGHLELRFDITRLFRGADFSRLADSPTGPDGRVELVQARSGRDQVMTNLYQGLREANGTYAVQWIDP
jgi:hypothetical protein